MIASVVAIAGTTTVLLGKKGMRAKVKQTIHETYQKVTGKGEKDEKEKQLKIGYSHPHDYEDNKMVGEGALTSVQYYNKKQQMSHQ